MRSCMHAARQYVDLQCMQNKFQKYQKFQKFINFINFTIAFEQLAIVIFHMQGLLELAKRFASFTDVPARVHAAAGEAGAWRRPQGACGMAHTVTKARGNHNTRLTGAGAAVKVGPRL